MQTKTPEAAAVAEFLARGGKVKRVAEGVSGEQPAHGSSEWLWEMGFAAEAKQRVRG